MQTCSFCGQKSVLRAGRLRLCGRCLAQVTALSPDGAAYGWYAAAVRRAMFG